MPLVDRAKRYGNYLKTKYDMEKQAKEAVKLDGRIAIQRAVREYQIVRSFQGSKDPGVAEYRFLKAQDRDQLITDLIMAESTDPKIAAIQGQIKAWSEFLARPLDPRETGPKEVQFQDTDDND